MKRTNTILAIIAMATLAALWITANPCDIDGRHDPACKGGKP